MVLAGKTGLYSILRFSFAIFPAESHRIAPLMIALGAIGVVYGALIALTKNDMKHLAAYSTLGHLSIITLGIFTFTVAGVDGGIYQILNHGISGGALFILMGILYERYGTYDMRDYGGLAASLPWMVTLYVITTLSVVGLPGLNSFVGEFLVLSGTMQASFAEHHVLWTVVATSGVIFGAAYMLLMIQRVFYGPAANPNGSAPRDLDAREHTWPCGRWLRSWSSWAFFRPTGCTPSMRTAPPSRSSAAPRPPQPSTTGGLRMPPPTPPTSCPRLQLKE